MPGCLILAVKVLYGTLNANREALRKKFLTPSSNTETPLVTEDSSVVPNPNNLPSSPEAVVANPLQQKMAEYAQGRATATTQEEMDAVRDLGTVNPSSC